MPCRDLLLCRFLLHHAPRYPDAIRTFVTILNFIMRMRQYHTRSYQYDQISKTADRMYALFAMCHALSPSRLDDNIANIAKERYGEQYAKMARGGTDALAAFEELFVYACPKFIIANPPPYDDPSAINALISAAAEEEESASSATADATQRHLELFLADVAAQLPVPTLRSFLKLYTSLDAKKLANFLDADEEELVQEMMVLKQASRSISRVPGTEGTNLLEGQTITTSDLNFVIAEVSCMLLGTWALLIELYLRRTWSTSQSRRSAGGTRDGSSRTRERTQKILDDLKSMPLPAPSKSATLAAATGDNAGQSRPARTGAKVAWGSGVKAA